MCENKNKNEFPEKIKWKRKLKKLNMIHTNIIILIDFRMKQICNFIIITRKIELSLVEYSSNIIILRLLLFVRKMFLFFILEGQ